MFPLVIVDCIGLGRSAFFFETGALSKMLLVDLKGYFHFGLYIAGVFAHFYFISFSRACANERQDEAEVFAVRRRGTKNHTN
jgi:hypothetical protein